ncbi:MAG: Histone transcription regulator 3 [Trichoglossum hirsutum]|nr:MAG: Histone transcription regulator 3 [Trichoglossum hirsutum]
MSSFSALNIIPDDDSDSDVDNTKEIQIEEALKLYQNALKLHAQGSSHFAEAQDAYLALFRSEIFQYPESLSETRHLELYGQLPEYDNEYDDNVIESGAIVASGGTRGSADSAPSTLPQILYLSYKNHGQFALDCLRFYMRSTNGQVSSEQVNSNAQMALRCFTEALLRDDSDAELWRRISRISGVLESRRLVRYCLEAILDGEGDMSGSGLAGLGIEEGYAGDEIKKLLRVISDDFSLQQTLISQFGQKPLSSLLKKRMDPYPYLPQPSGNAKSSALNQDPLGLPPLRRNIDVVTPTWAALGRSILDIIIAEQGYINCIPVYGTVVGGGSGILISLPGGEGQSDEEMAIEEVMEGPESQILGEIAAADSRSRKDSKDDGVPETAVTSDGDVQMGDATAEAGGRDQERMSKTQGDPEALDMATKKRKSSPESVQGPLDGGRGRSKRIRARESNASAAISAEISAIERANQFEEKLQVFVDADEYLFECLGNLFDKLGVTGLGTLQDLKLAISEEEVCATADSEEEQKQRREHDTVIRDLRKLLTRWDDDKGNVILYGDGIDDPGGRAQPSAPGGSRNAGLMAFLEHAKTGGRKVANRPLLSGGQGLDKFARRVNKQWLHVNEVAFRWLECLLVRERQSTEGILPLSTSAGLLGEKDMASYSRHLWPDALKEAVVQMIVILDAFIYQKISSTIADRNLDLSSNDEDVRTNSTYIEMAQTIFELHLDIYTSITNPSSEVDLATRIAQKDRVARWCMIASDLINVQPKDEDGTTLEDHLTLRYLWSCALYASISEDVSREHVIACFEDPKTQLQSAGNPVIDLPNNALMPEVSAAQAEREISRLKTTDFFLNIFQSHNANPVDVIEILEPVLDPQAVRLEPEDQHMLDEVEVRELVKEIRNIQLKDEALPISEEWDRFSLAEIHAALQELSIQHTNTASAQLRLEKVIGDLTDKLGRDLSGPLVSGTVIEQVREMSAFLERGNASLRLFLLQKLREAYDVIDYPPKVFSCYLKSVEIIMKEFRTSTYLESSSEHRQFTLLKWLRALEDLILRALMSALNDPRAFDCMDQEHLVSSMSALAELSRLLHSFALYEDAVNVGQVPPFEPFDYAFAQSLAAVANKLQELQVRTWTLQYALFREAIAQNQDVFTEPAPVLIEFLCAVHHAIGIRMLCKMSNKVFLRFMKKELLRLSHVDGWEQDMAQVLFDLYGIKLGSGIYELHNHGCQPEALDRSTALQIIDFVLLLVRRINIKDLAKTEYKPIIDKLQQVIGVPKQTATMVHNSRIFDAYIKSPINPLDLYRSLKGEGELSRVTVNGESASLAEKGWYFLNGHVALAKWRSAKRVTPTPPEDVNIAIIFFKFDLHNGMNGWETWYRIAQCYDSLLEEEVLWLADTLNNNKESINLLQRHAIHCYTMAVATALRSADPSPETAHKISDMFTDFGTRVYASSRPPFDSEAFRLDNFKRLFSGAQGMYENKAHSELTEYKAWKFAHVLFKKALAAKPDYWINHYMLGKCLGKMYNTPGQADVTVQEVIDCYVRAVETVPERRDRQDPIFEPHYKLVSVVHKLVQGKSLEPSEGSVILEATPYARKIPPAQELDTWDTYVLQILKKLRSADKANWHHRMIDRAAHINYDYDESSTDLPAAMAARHLFSQQIFTKTMTWQIWKPEYERAGRHFVYTSKYTYFFLKLLDQLKDRTSMEALVKRLRKKPSDFWQHQEVWRYACHTYLKLLRRNGQVPEAHDDTVFKSITLDEFQALAQRLESWCLMPSSSHPTLDLVRDVVELKKLNGGLWKNTIIDDLAIDAYAKLYETIVPDIQAKIGGEQYQHQHQHQQEQQHQERKDPMSLKNLMMNVDSTSGASTPPQTMQPGLEDPVTTLLHQPKPRTRVGRRDILRRAENLAVKPTVQAMHQPRAPTSHLTTTAAVAATAPALAPTSAPRGGLSGPAMLQVASDTPGRGTETTGGSSVAGSVHDSADDESELSDEEVDEAYGLRVHEALESGSGQGEGATTGDES